MLLAGGLLMWPPYASGSIGQMTIAVQTLGGAASLVIGLVLMMCGIAVWAAPPRVLRILLGVLAGLLGVIAVVVANLGMFLIATTLAIVGAACTIPWRPVTVTPAPPRLEPVDTEAVEQDVMVTAQKGVGSWPA